MPDTKARLLIVDDEPSIRTSLALIFTQIGYGVQTAEDGFSALAEMRKEVPDILLSDLNMSGMSGFELLSVVRQRFPGLRTIAMSGAFSSGEVPSGVAADAFYQKGSGVGSLMKIMETFPWHERKPAGAAAQFTPVWTERGSHRDAQDGCVTISCTECLRTFTQELDETASQTPERACIHCHSVIPTATAWPAAHDVSLPFQPSQVA